MRVCHYCKFAIDDDGDEIGDACAICQDEVDRCARDDEDAEHDEARQALERSAPVALAFSVDDLEEQGDTV